MQPHKAAALNNFWQTKLKMQHGCGYGQFLLKYNTPRLSNIINWHIKKILQRHRIITYVVTTTCICISFCNIHLHYYSDWVCTAVMSKWRYERSSRLMRNLSNCEREAWKKFRLQRDSNPWPLRYRCSALPTELWSHNCWEHVNFSGSIMPLRVIQHYSDWVCTLVAWWTH